MHNLFIHIGLHKTGTSFLQNYLFSNLKHINLVRGWDKHRQFMQFDIDKNILISDEALSGNLWNNEYLQSFKDNMERIKIIYGNPRIIVGFRKHDSFILSVYKQYLHEGGWKSFDYIFNENNTGLIKHHELFFSERIKILKNYFSEVFIYTQEDLLHTPEKVINAMTRYLHCENLFPLPPIDAKKSNIGVNTILQIKYLRNLNKVNNTLKSNKLIPSKPINFIQRKLNLTPRYICQHYLKAITSPKFKIDTELKKIINNYYLEDWKEVLDNVSY